MHCYLPKLDPTKGEPTAIQRPAHWQPGPVNLLEDVAKSIDLSTTQAQARGVSSIPHVWARALLFQTTLRAGPDHPLHDQAVKEWRGLLSLLALREIYHYPVEIVPVSTQHGGRFGNALERLAPSPVELEPGTAYTWTDILMILYDKEPIGALSPGSLVYTATGYQKRLRGKNLDLCSPDGSLRPPTKENDEHTAHYVAEWVDELVRQVESPLSQANSPESSDIIGLLRAWRDDLRRAFGYPPGDTPRMDAPNVKWSTNGPAGLDPNRWVPLGNYTIYQHILTPLEEDEASGTLKDRSSIFLQAGQISEGEPRIYLQHNGHAVKGVVVIHEQTLTQDAQIWGLRRLRSLGSSISEVLSRHFDAPAGYEIAGKDLSRDDAVWIRPERYFLTDIMMAPRTGAGNHILAQGERRTNAGGEYLLPFRKTILDFFSPEDIEAKLKPEFDTLRDGSVRFSFELPIGPLQATGGDGAPAQNTLLSQFQTQADVIQTIRIERIYKEKRDGDPDDDYGTLIRKSLPVLDLFPNYLGPTWRRYFLFQSDTDQYTTIPYAHGAKIEDRVRKDEKWGPRHTARLFEIHGDNAFPEGVELRFPTGEALGLILTQKPQWDRSGLTGTWVIGIDFGTSNTTVYRQQGGSPAEVWDVDLPSHLRSLTVSTSGAAGKPQEEAEKSATEQKRNELLQRFFVPNRKVTFPVATFLDVRIPGNQLQHGRLLLDYFVHFPSQYTWPASVRYNIKWDEPKDRVTKQFLESLLYLILLKTTAARVQTIDLRCTYPEAFSRDERTMFEGAWTQVHESIVSEDSAAAFRVLDGLTTHVQAPSYLNEATAVATFFSSKKTGIKDNQRANQGKSVCVDVGGGTTDIAFWYGGKIVHDDSLRLAGGQIAEYIRQRPKIMEFLFTKEAVRDLRAAQNDADLFGTRLNLVLRNEDKAIRDHLISHGNRTEIQQLRHLIALEFGSIAFHIGTMLGAAEQWDQAAGLREDIAKSGISLHWGGNASKLLTWIDFGNYKPDGLAADLLNGLLLFALKDAKMEPNVNLMLQAQSPKDKYKHEAAAGAAVEESVRDARQHSGGRAAKDRIVVCGENIALKNGNDLKFLDSVSVDKLFDDRQHRIASISGERLILFINSFNELGTRFDFLNADSVIRSDDAYRIKIAEQAKDHYVKMQHREHSNRYVESIFITEVRELLGLVIAER